jgi:hypothetical protein
MKRLWSGLLAAIMMGWSANATIAGAGVSIDGVSLKFLPPETQGIVCIDLAALRNAPLVQDALKGQNFVVPRDLSEFTIATGIDPQRDIDKVTIAKLGAQDGLVIVQGRFDKLKVEQLLKDNGKRPEAYLGQALYRDGNNALVFFDGVVLAGHSNAVKKAVEHMQLPGSPPLRSELNATMQTIEAGSQIWAAGDVSINDLRAVGVPSPAPAAEVLKSLRSGTYQMRVDTGIQALATGNFADAESARNIADLVRGVLAVAKLQAAKQQPDMVQLLDGIQVDYSGSTLTVRIVESGEQLKKLKDLAPKALGK